VHSECPARSGTSRTRRRWNRATRRREARSQSKLT
jgi:hypothetical protein